MFKTLDTSPPSAMFIHQLMVVEGTSCSTHRKGGEHEWLCWWPQIAYILATVWTVGFKLQWGCTERCAWSLTCFFIL